MNKFKYHFIGAFIFLGTIFLGLGVYALDWSGLTTVKDGDTLNANVWTNTMNNIKNNIEALNASITNINNSLTTINNQLNGTSKLVGRTRQYTDASFDCTFGGEFPNGDTSFKYNLGNGVYKCEYMFPVGNANDESSLVWVCPSKGLKDAEGIKIPLSWKKDPTTWGTMWTKAKNTSAVGYGEFLLLGNAGDRTSGHYMGMNLIFNSSQPNKVLPQYGNRNDGGVWNTPAANGSQRADYATYGFVICEL
ncbi:MAG: hypothetical protein PHG82_00350 [Candidatus Gracilibacteria bacterium]|nr:hypothetical protein [Candidatus Gracilibacteria bacterium]